MGNVDDLLSRLKVQQTSNQIAGQKAHLAAMQGGDPNAPEPHQDSMIGHVFNILGRGRNVSARLVEDTIKGVKAGSVGQVLSAPVRATFTGGIMGKSKTFSDVIGNDLGIKNPWVKGIGGLIGDIALDPTTYLGVGLFKTPEEVAQAAKEAKVAVDAVQEASKVGKELAPAARGAATRAAQKTALSESIKAKHTAEATSAAMDAAKEAVQAQKTAKVAEEGIGAARVQEGLAGPRVQLKARIPLTKTQKVFAEIPLDKPFGGASKLAKDFLATNTGDSLAKFFSTPYLYGKEGRNIVRRFTNAGAAGFEAKVKNDIRPLFKGLTDEHKSEILNALRNDSLDLSHSTATNSSGKTLQEIKDTIRGHWDQHIQDAIDRGIYTEADRVKNYVPHFFQEKGPEYNKFVRARRQGQFVQQLDKAGKPVLDAAGKPVLEKVAKYSLEEAEKAGLKPITDLEHMMVMKEAKQTAQIAHNDISHALLKEYGVAITDKHAAKWAANNGLVKVGDRTSSHASAAMSRIFDLSNKAEAAKAGAYYIPERVARSLKNIDELHTNSNAAGQFLRTVDKVQKPWKFMATAANPGHHLRNMQGDMWLNWEDGVADPRHYAKAFNIIGRDTILPRSQEAINAARDAVKVKVGGGVLNGHDIMNLFERSGARSGMIRQEFGAEGGGLKGIIEKIRTGAETREDFGRVAHFIHALQEEGAGLSKAEIEALKAGHGPTEYAQKLLDSANRAGDRVRHWNIDYGDLTPAERKYMTRAMPFYTFMRKNIPLQMEAIAMRPGRVAALPKVANAMEQVLGTAGQNDILPQFIKDSMHVRLRGEGEGKNSVYWVPKTPVEDAANFFQGGVKGTLTSILSGASPLGKIPIEETYGRAIYGSQAPIKSQPEYFAGQVPIGRTIYNAVKGAPPGTQANVGGRKLSIDQLVNYLTAAGMRTITPAQQQSELRRQQTSLKSQINAEKRKMKRKALGQ